MSEDYGQQQWGHGNQCEDGHNQPAVAEPDQQVSPGPDQQVSPAPDQQVAPEGNVPVYRVRAVPRERAWMVDVPDVGLTQAGRLGDVEARARDLISLRRGDEQVYRVDVEVDLDQSIRDDLATATRARAEATALEAKADQAMVSAARKLLSSTVSLRDAAKILGLSHQRLSALARVDSEREPQASDTPA